MNRCRLVLTLLALAAVWLPCEAYADVALASVFGDHMVLQRERALPVWGSAAPGEQVQVELAGSSRTTVADGEGAWRLTLPALKAGGPFILKASGQNEVTVSDVLIGEVWLCSGQSNMAWAVRDSKDARREITAAEYPKLRLLTVAQQIRAEPTRDVGARWAVCSPRTVGGFSAVAYYFGRELQRSLGVPVGLVHASWGGTCVETWIPRAALEAEPGLAPLLARWDRAVASYDPAKAESAFRDRLQAWKRAKEAGKRQPHQPRPPVHPRVQVQRPANLYNGMIHPLLPFAMRGAIWYQGESNAARAHQYRTLFPALIKSWRDRWQQGEFPFYYVQLANFGQSPAKPGPSRWAELREAQSMALSLPNTGQAVAIDIGAARDIHPRNKQEVGRRLALIALARDYGQSELSYAGPRFRSLGWGGEELVLRFEEGSKLVARGELRGFTLAGADRVFHPAEARVLGDSVLLRSPRVSAPVAARYGWAENPTCTLFNEAGLPASPFRTDSWPGVTVGKH